MLKNDNFHDLSRDLKRLQNSGVKHEVSHVIFLNLKTSVSTSMNTKNSTQKVIGNFFFGLRFRLMSIILRPFKQAVVANTLKFLNMENE